VLATLLVLMPSALVQILNLKIGSPKGYFIEPGRIVLALFGLSMVVMGFAGIAIPLSLGVKNDFVVGFCALAGFCLPINIYTVYIFTRYKRVVEYGTGEWRRRRKQ
jgi:hypothetical protein